MTERTLKLAANALGDFYIHIYCADGSVCAEGPFESGEAAISAMKEMEAGTYWLVEYDE